MDALDIKKGDCQKTRKVVQRWVRKASKPEEPKENSSEVVKEGGAQPSATVGELPSVHNTPKSDDQGADKGGVSIPQQTQGSW